jgi:(p)ppGpp synthase/HD superfamily hydrolase
MNLAEQTARTAHANQKYGDGAGAYADAHLGAVVAVLADFGFVDATWNAAGWLHDALEDTPMTAAEVRQAFGPEVADLVWAVTGEGADRNERNQSIYRKIAATPKAATLKLADRIANVEASAGTRFLAKYKNEQPEFEKAVRPHVSAEMWIRLERAFTQAAAD